MTIIQILLPSEVIQFDKAPTFNELEKHYYFSMSKAVQAKVSRAEYNTNKIGLIIQYGYFKATGKFYMPIKYRKKDIKFIAKKLKIKDYGKLSEYYRDDTRRKHKKYILEILGFSSFSKKKILFDEIIDGFISKQMHPKNIIFSIVDLLRSKKVEIPNYDTFAKAITFKINSFEQDLINKINLILEPEQKKALDGLIETPTGSYQRAILTRLKTINQSVKPGQIKQSIHAFLIIKKLYNELEPAINKLNLSPEATRYYAEWTAKAKVTQIVDGITDESKRYLYLLAFISHQLKMRQDIFVDILLKCIQQYQNKVKALVDEINVENIPEKNRLTNKVLDGVAIQQTDINKLRKILYNDRISDDKKLSIIRQLIPKESTKTEKELHDFYDQLKRKVDDEEENTHYYSALEALSRKLQNRVSDIVKYIEFNVSKNESELDDALTYYQKNNCINKSAPDSFLNDEEYETIYKEEKINISLYKSVLYIKISNAIKSGLISIEKSYRYMPIESYLIDKNEWTKNKDKLLEQAGLSEFINIDNLLFKLKSVLDSSFYKVNENIINGVNKNIRIKKDGTFIVHTPAVIKPDYEPISELIGKDRYVPVLQMMSEINNITQFTSNFKHHKVKGSRAVPSDEIFFAGIFSLGSNIDLHKLANTAIGVNYNTLSNTVNWYFSLENVHAVNDMITNFINELWLPTQFKKEIDFLHTSGDGQKRNVSAESLNANYSYKYFGHGKGSNIYTFMDERGIFFYPTVFSSAERDAAYVLDGLLHNDSFKSDMHSTDTDGYSETVFALSHLINTTFAPRIKDIASKSLVSFGRIRRDLEKKEYHIKPKNYVNIKLIKNNWDIILRLVATLKLRHHKPSTILKRLNSYDNQHYLHSAIKEFGRIISSIFTLKYIDDVELRQTIEKQLNKGELANKFSSAVSFANDHEIIQIDKTDQEIAVVCKTIIQNIIILWNYIELTKIIMRSDLDKQKAILENITKASVIMWKHVNMLGTYDFSNFESKYNERIEIDNIINFKAA